MTYTTSIVVYCEFNASPKCKVKYKTSSSNARKIKSKNNGKIICRFCSFFTKYEGRKNPNKKYNFDDHFFNKIDTQEKAYLLGWIASDGHVSKRGFSITIHGEDRKCIELLRNIICAEIPITTHYDQKYKHDNVSLNISSKQISRDLCKILRIKPGKKSYTLKFPLLDQDVLTREFVKGYFEGDGTLNNRLKANNNYPYCGITSRSHSILHGLCQLQFNFHKNWRWVYWGGKNAMQFLDWIYQNPKLVLDRKYFLYLDWKTNFVPDKHIGENHYLAKLTEKDVQSILEANKSGVSQNKLSKIYKVSRRTIQDIIYGKTWKKVIRIK